MSDNRLNMVDFARDLARRGLREDALLILDLLPAPDTVETLDLRARILVQLGRYTEAEDNWQQVQAQCPEHVGASEGLAAAAGLRRSPLRRLRVALALRFCRVASTALVVLLVLLLVVGSEWLRRRLNGLSQGQENLVTALAENEKEVNSVLVKLRQDAADLASLQLRTGDALSALKTDQDAMRQEVAGKIEATRKELAAAVGQTTTTLQKDVTAIKAGTKAEMEKQRGAQETALKGLGDLLATLEKQQQSANASVAKLATASGESEAALAKSLADLKNELATTKKALAEIGKNGTAQAASMAETKAQLVGKIDALAKQLEAVIAADPTQRLADLSAQYLQLRSSLNTQGKRTEELTAQLKSLGEQLAAPGQGAAQPAPAP